MMQQSQTTTRRLLASGSWQTSAATTYFDGSGRVAAMDSASVGLPETCTSTSYATAPSGNMMMLAYPDQVTTVAGGYAGGSCPAPLGRIRASGGGGSPRERPILHGGQCFIHDAVLPAVSPAPKPTSAHGPCFSPAHSIGGGRRERYSLTNCSRRMSACPQC